MGGADQVDPAREQALNDIDFESRAAQRGYSLSRAVQAWTIWAALGLTATALYFVVPPSWQISWYAVVAVATAGAMAYGIVRHKPKATAHWWVLAAGVLLMAGGDVVWAVYETALGREVPFPSSADAFYLASYPVTAVGLFLIVRRRLPGRDIASLVDATIITTGAGLAVWVFLIAPVAGDSTVTLGARAVSTAYPVLDITLLALGVRLAFTGGRRTFSSTWVVAVLLLTVVADVSYGILELQSMYAGGEWVDSLYLVAYVGWGIAALHPSMRRIDDVVPDTARRAVPAKRVVFLGAATLTAPGVLGVQALRGAELHLPEIIGASVALFLLVVARLAGLLRQLNAVAMHDVLTGLPNRGVLMERLRHELREAGPGQLAALFIDLDRFKDVNDSLGHPAGDRLLTEVALRLRLAVREHDMVARFGGDEFVIIARVRDRAEAIRIAERVIDGLAEPVWLDEAPIFPAASVGVAVAAGGTDDADVLLADADAAMFRAKARGKACYEVFDETMRGGALERLAVEAELRLALENDEIRVHYQPVVAIADGRVVGHEALVRWYHPDGQVRLPGQFLPVAEETGLIVPIGERVLDQALAQLREWIDAAPSDDLRMAVNLSSRQLAQLDLVAMVRSALERHRIEPKRLYLEVTEQAALDDWACEALLNLRELGVRIAIDDFGTGYSSLQRLRRFRFDVLKVDRSYVSSIHDPDDRAIVQAILAMATALDTQVVAEGVETDLQLRVLRELGCPVAQGFLLGPPARGVASPAATAPAAASPALMS